MLYDEYCHNDGSDEEHDCLDYMECEQCPYYYADLDDLEVQIMTIDEAIKEEQTLYDIAKDKYEKLGIKNCLKRMEEHKQYIEWLEELKMYKSLAPRELVSQKQKNDRAIEYSKGFDYGFKTGYNKALDDFVKKINESNQGHWRPTRYEHGEVVSETMSYDIGTIRLIADQLKEENTND